MTCLGVQSPSAPSTGHQDGLGVLDRTRFPPSAVQCGDQPLSAAGSLTVAVLTVALAPLRSPSPAVGPVAFLSPNLCSPAFILSLLTHARGLNFIHKRTTLAEASGLRPDGVGPHWHRPPGQSCCAPDLLDGGRSWVHCSPPPKHRSHAGTCYLSSCCSV